MHIKLTDVTTLDLQYKLGKSKSKLKVFLSKIKHIDIVVPIMLIGFYGLRRSEAIRNEVAKNKFGK